MVTPRNGELLIAATQDFLTSSYLLTRKDTFLTESQAILLANSLISGSDNIKYVTLPPPAILKPIKMWTGKQIFGLIIRPNMECPIKANLRTKGKAYTADEEMCINDSCE